MGNYFAKKYQEHQEYHVRQKMRDLGHLLIVLCQKNEEIKELLDVFRPKYFPTVLDAIN